jgi:hypothetical protein
MVCAAGTGNCQDEFRQRHGAADPTLAVKV